jgi:hypothetical protein
MSGLGTARRRSIAGSAKRRREVRRAARIYGRDHLGGTEGNAILTSATAIVLTALLAVEGYTVVNMRGIVSLHMFVGLVLIPPVLLKLASTGYRFVRYYRGSHGYRSKGPPQMPLRVLAPVLVASTIAVLATGVLLLAAGQKSHTLLFLHKVSFIAFAIVFAVHFVAHVPRAVGSLRSDWAAARRQAVPGAGLRGMLLAAAVGGGFALALSLLPAIYAWRGGH